MRYCIDTSALIDLGERSYPEHLPVFDPIWKHLYAGIDSGELVSVWKVKDELEAKAGKWCEDFIVQTNGMFLLSVELELEYANVISDIEKGPKFLPNKHRKRFMEGADPWVISQAREIGDCTVISSETKSLADYGMVPVCKELSVKHMSQIGRAHV